MHTKYRAFTKEIYEYYRENKRDLPWRAASEPYHIVVSEIMLQQTQVDRVIPKYTEFLKRFPDWNSLASAPLRDVLYVWSGLGYNRRAQYLKESAVKIIKDHDGKLPETKELLITLPGVGRNTAGAIIAFAYDRPVIFIETNIRSVFIHFFFKGKDQVIDSDILSLVEESLDRDCPRKWYSALMDYGAMLKKTRLDPNHKSAHHTKQSCFSGSTRQARGAIVRVLLKEEATSIRITQATRLEHDLIESQINALIRDGLVVQRGKKFTLA